VAEAIKKNSKVASRLLLPYKRTDTAIVNSETSSRVDIALRCGDVKDEPKLFEANFDSSAEDKKQRENADRLYYEDVFALIEVKRHASASDEAGAFEQLVRYTREVYDKQHNRRFAWGLTICGLDLRVCVFGANYILASEKFDLKAESGKRKAAHRLGYDPTVRRLKKLGCWEIDVSILENPGPCSKASARVDTFYSNTVIISADRQFGRLTRCFLAGREKPSSSESVKHIEHQVIIKDAWPEAEMDASNDMRDEVAHLSKIQRLMPDSSNASGAYPALEAGGRVCFSHDPRLRGSDDRVVEDNTRSLIGEIFDAINESEGDNREAVSPQINRIPYRVHKRIATSPIGEPLRRLESILELVIVVADAM
ncbi:hypothetical protein LPJ75_002914, partial [Coemansia sp. RSA 2598]